MTHPVDVHVGKKIRQRRWLTGMTQQQLAEQVGIKFQQIQKYETGANRVSASRLWDISDALEVPVSFFFEGLEAAEGDMGNKVPADLMGDKEALDYDCRKKDRTRPSGDRFKCPGDHLAGKAPCDPGA